ncbi:MAG: hypothetical protein ACRBN8_19565 [Nannocystales bacterium]
MRVQASLVLLSSLLGCDADSFAGPNDDVGIDDVDGDVERAARGLRGAFSTQTPVPSSAPPTQRYIAMMPADTQCPEVPDWNHRPLFRLTTSAEAAWNQWGESGGVMPPILARFCVYTTPVPLDSPPAVPGSVRVDPDLAVVVPQAAPLPPVPQARADLFLAQLGAAPSGITPSGSNPYVGDPDGLPYVAVVDTADSTSPGTPTVYPNPANWAPAQRHGLTMAALIDATRCPSSEPNCLGRQYRAQAFPFDSAQAQPEPAVLGGQWASLGSLASALGEALARWRAQPDNATAPLTLNLSVGWDPVHGTIPASHELLLDPYSPDPSVPATVQAVHSALAWASCQGVITVAASGNRRGAGCSESGPLAPASWESLPPVSASVCSSIAGAYATYAAVPSLTHGAGGLVDSSGPLSNTRLASLPNRVFYAHQGTVPVGGGFTEALTGSSLAAAAFSSLVAVVQSHTSPSSETSVIDTIDNLGTPSNIDSDWFQQGITNANRLRFDQVFAATVGPYSPYQAQGGDRLDDAIANEIFSQPQMAPNPDELELSPEPSASTTCGAVLVTTALSPDTDVPSDTQSETDELRPQPHVPICPTCPVLNTSRNVGPTGSASPLFALYLRIDSAYDPAHITQASLTFEDRSNSTGLNVTFPAGYVNAPLTVVDLTKATFPNGTTVNDWLTAHPQAKSAALSFSLDDGSGTGAQPIRQVVDIIH